MSAEYELLQIASTGITGMILLASCAGVVVAWRFRALSSGMLLLLAGFTFGAADAAASLAVTVLHRVLYESGPPHPLMLLVYVMTHLFGLAALMLVVLGLARTLREARGRFQRLRAALEGRRDEPAGTPEI